MNKLLIIAVLGAGCWVLGAGCWGDRVNELTNLDLCSGLGLFARAAREAGFRTIGVAEVNPYCNQILTREFPGVPNFGDIKQAAWTGVGHVSLITAGYPCQPFSSLGKRRGESDPRHLWPSVRRAVKETGPDWFVGENVIGHVDLGLDQVLSDLEDLDYTAQPITIPACAVGADFVGERVWILASANRLRLRGSDDSMDAYSASAGPDFNGISRAPLGAWSDDTLHQPRLVRAGHGRSTQLHRITALGNAVVWQQAYPILATIAHIQKGLIA